MKLWPSLSAPPAVLLVREMDVLLAHDWQAGFCMADGIPVD